MLETKPRCKHYKAKEIKGKENCANCFRWIGIECIGHIELIKRYETTRKFAELDKAMKSNKGVWIG